MCNEDFESKVQGAMQRFADSDVGDLVYSLKCRWDDEKEYEDWAGYVSLAKIAVERYTEDVLTFVKLSKKPFGITASITIDDKLVNLILSATSSKIKINAKY